MSSRSSSFSSTSTYSVVPPSLSMSTSTSTSASASASSDLDVTIMSPASDLSPVPMSPQEPRCLTPYPHRTLFARSKRDSPSPISCSSPTNEDAETGLIFSHASEKGKSEAAGLGGQVAHSNVNVYASARNAKSGRAQLFQPDPRTPQPQATVERTHWKRLIPPELRMSPMAHPTRSSSASASEEDPVVLPLSPMRRRAHTVPFSWETHRQAFAFASATGASSENKIKRPEPLVIPLPAHRGTGRQTVLEIDPLSDLSKATEKLRFEVESVERSSKVSTSEMTPRRPSLSRTTSDLATAPTSAYVHDHNNDNICAGSMSIPKTPGSVGSGATTARPLTCRRVGSSEAGADDEWTRGEEVEGDKREEEEGREAAEEPRLGWDRSPGWAEFGGLEDDTDGSA